MKKKIFALCIVLFCVFMLAGCGSVNFSLSISNDGVVTQAFSLVFSEQDILNSGKTVEEFKEEVRNVEVQIVNKSITAFDTRFTDDAVKNTFDGNTKTYAEIKTYVKSNLDISNVNSSINWKKSDNNWYCQFYLRFLTIQSYNYFYGHFNDETDTDETIKVDYGFYQKELTYQDSIFSDITSNSVATYFLNYFGDSFKLDDINYSYTYITPSTHIYSDADSISTNSAGYNVHTWNFTAKQLESVDGGKICLYTISFRAWLWYLTAVVISILVGVVIFVVCKVKETKNKSKKCFNGALIGQQESEKKDENVKLEKELNEGENKKTNNNIKNLESTNIENNTTNIENDTENSDKQTEKLSNKTANIK